MTNKVVVIGAGKTGRGFLGRLLQEAGKQIIFIDKDPALVDKLNTEKNYSVSFFGNRRAPVLVDRYTAYGWENATLEDAELIFVSVGGQNLKDVGEKLSALLRQDKRYYIITCENAANPVLRLKEAIGEKNVAVSEATVFCTTIESDGYNINSENYPYLQCNAQLLEGYVPDIASVKAVDHFSNFLTRKLFTYNAASCVIAYNGALLGYTDYGEAANDPTILALLDKNYAATNVAMCRQFGYDLEDQKEFADLSKTKFCDKTIVDTIARNAREPQRKLSPNERIIGAAKLLQECGTDTSVLALTAAAALLYQDPADAVWCSMQSENSYADLLKTLCGLQESDKLYQAIFAFLQALKTTPQETIQHVAST